MLLCTFFGHARASRHKVWDDGLDLRSSCRRCRTPLVKDGRRWRPFLPADHDIRRAAKPDRHSASSVAAPHAGRPAAQDAVTHW